MVTIKAVEKPEDGHSFSLTNSYKMPRNGQEPFDFDHTSDIGPQTRV